VTKHVNANDYPEIFSDLGINLGQLGCVMLDLAPIHVTGYIPETEGKIENELYVSPNPDRFWVNGAMSERKAHMTLLYGLLSKDWQDHIRTVLADWDTPLFVEIDGLEVFPSPYDDEQYVCIVARVKVTPQLQEGHARLELLPHVNTFLEWRTHVTLAYVRAEYRDKWVSALEKNLPPIIPVTGIDIGDQHD
jgi:2'-5' RNA ligase